MRPLVLLLACLLAAGCAPTGSGQPTTTPTSAPPQRPREVRLDGVDPCSLLTTAQRAELGFTSTPSSSRPYVELFRGEVPTCVMYSSSPGSVLLGIGAVTTVGIERWEDGDVAAQVRPTTIAGFPAVVAAPTQSTTYCSVEVDVAAGQLLDVQISDAGDKPPTPQDSLCRRADRSAEQMIKTLLAR